MMNPKSTLNEPKVNPKSYVNPGRALGQAEVTEPKVSPNWTPSQP